MNAEISKTGALDMQVCVPKIWSDSEATSFANKENPCGTQHGWNMRKDEDKFLNGANERVNCSDRDGFVHIMLDA